MIKPVFSYAYELGPMAEINSVSKLVAMRLARSNERLVCNGTYIRQVEALLRPRVLETTSPSLSQHHEAASLLYKLHSALSRVIPVHAASRRCPLAWAPPIPSLAWQQPVRTAPCQPYLLDDQQHPDDHCRYVVLGRFCNCCQLRPKSRYFEATARVSRNWSW